MWHTLTGTPLLKSKTRTPHKTAKTFPCLIRRILIRRLLVKGCCDDGFGGSRSPRMGLTIQGHPRECVSGTDERVVQSSAGCDWLCLHAALVCWESHWFYVSIFNTLLAYCVTPGIPYSLILITVSSSTFRCINCGWRVNLNSLSPYSSALGIPYSLILITVSYSTFIYMYKLWLTCES